MIVGTVVGLNLPGGPDRLWADCSRSVWRIDVPGRASVDRAADLDNCSVIHAGDSTSKVVAILGEPSSSNRQNLFYGAGQSDWDGYCEVQVRLDPSRKVRALTTRECER